MFVRRKINRSGTISVHVVDKSRGAYKVLKVFGPASTAQEADLLENKAREYMQRQTGRMGSLFSDHDEGIINGEREGQVQVAGPDLIFGALYDRLGFGAIKDELFRHLVICRLFDPGSKMRTIGYLKEYLGKEYKKGLIYNYLDNLDLKDKVERLAFNYAKKATGDALREVFCFLSTLDYEAAGGTDLRLGGFKKEGRPRCPQLLLGLLVNADGNLLGYELYDKNAFSPGSIVPAIEKLTSKHRFPRPVVIADIGILSKESILTLDLHEFKYIVCTHPRSERDATGLIVTKVDCLVGKDAQNRGEEIARLKKKLAGRKLTKANINNRGSNRFLKIEGRRRIAIDMDKVDAEAAWDGVRGFITNSGLANAEVIAKSSELWSIAQAFCMNKADLRVRPLHNTLLRRIEGHICICFAAYSVSVLLDGIIKKADADFTIERIRGIVNTMYRLNYVSSSTRRRMSVLLQMDAEQRQLYELVNPGK